MLFEGLAITKLSKDDHGAFEPHTVFYFDMNRDNYKKGNWVLKEVLEEH